MHCANTGVHFHIPAFVGADQAAERLATHPAWPRALAIKANPDRAQLPVRVRALHAGKTVYMAVPNLASPQPFYLLDPSRLPMPPEQAAIHQVAATFAPTVSIADMPPIDLVVCGIVDGPLPETTHDFRVDVIATPTRVIDCPPSRRPAGVVWEHLTAGKIDAIPALANHPARRHDGERAVRK